MSNVYDEVLYLVVGVFIIWFIPYLLKFLRVYRLLRRYHYPRCVCMLSSISAQLFVFISISLALVFCFSDSFIELLEMRKKTISLNAESGAEVFSYVESKIDSLFDMVNKEGRKAKTLSNNDIFSLKYSCKNVKLKMKDGKLQIVYTGGVVELPDKGEVKVHFLANSFYEDSTLSVLEFDSLYCVVADIAKLFLNDGRLPVRAYYYTSASGTKKYFKSSDITIRKKKGIARNVIDGQSKGSLRVGVEVDAEHFNFDSSKLVSLVKSNSKLTDIEKSATFSPMMRFNSEFLSASPMLIAFTAIFTMMIGVFGGYISEKIRFAYMCRRHCTKRVFSLIAIPTIGGLFTLRVYMYYFTLEYDNIAMSNFFINPSLDSASAILPLAKVPLIVAFVYLLCKRSLRFGFKDLFEDEIWSYSCVQLDEKANVSPNYTRR